MANRIAPIVALMAASTLARGDEPAPRPAVGWTIETVVQAPAIAFPTAVVAAPDGTIYLGQDPMDMPGPPTRPIDSVVAIKDGAVRTFAGGLWAVMGLEWVDGTLYVVHAPFLSSFRDSDGDGRADLRVDLVTGLGPEVPGFSGLNDHIAAGLRLGIDGFLYVAIGDKGLPRAVGRDGTTVSMRGGGVVRVRPDGSGLEVVSTGERNPLSTALTDRDDVFTFGNDDDSKRWPNSLTHHIDGGHYGYPYQFLAAPWRALPIVAGEPGGAGAQCLVVNEDGLPRRDRGNLLACDWGRQVVHRFEVVADGATFRLGRREPLVEKGGVLDFRPFAIAPDSDRSSLLLVDWAYPGWLADGPRTGRLYRLRPDRREASDLWPLAKARDSIAAALVEIDHPALSVRLAAQRRLIGAGRAALGPVSARLAERARPTGRVHALWALDRLGAADPIRAVLDDPDSEIRAQAARSIGIRRDAPAVPDLIARLGDDDPRVRREAAIALGRVGRTSAGPALLAAIADRDPTVAWSVRAAIRRLGAWSTPELVAALTDPRRRDEALVLVDESYAPAAVAALVEALGATPDPAGRARIVANLAGQYRRELAWDGRWFGTNPLAGTPPAKTADWDPIGQATVVTGLIRGLGDPAPTVRRQAILGLAPVGEPAIPALLAALPGEADPTNRAALVAALGRSGDARVLPAIATLIQTPGEPLGVRMAALETLGGFGQRQAMVLRLRLLYDPSAPPELIARALPALGAAGALPANDLADFLDGKPTAVRIAALGALAAVRTLPRSVQGRVLGLLDDADPAVRGAAIATVGRRRIVEAVPRLVTLARDEPTRAEAVRALALMAEPRGLDAFLAALDDRDPGLRSVAAAALLAIRDRVGPDLRRRAANGSLGGSAAAVVERVLADFRPVVGWKTIGPFPRATGRLFADGSPVDLARTHLGVDGRAVAWSDRPADPATGRITLDDLKAGQGDLGGFGYDANTAPDLQAFALAEIASEADRPALLAVGSSGRVIATLNGQAILDEPAPDGSPTSAVPIRLRRGANRLVLRLRQGVGVWDLRALVSDASETIGGPVSPSSPLDLVRSFAIEHSGDVRKGAELFADPKGFNCVRCHAVGGKGGGGLGPDLAGIARTYDKAEIIRSVLEPSARIATGFRPTMIARRDGTVVTGLVRAETDAAIDLVDADGRIVRVARSEIAERRAGDVSTMPRDLVAGLAPVDFADLIAYLASLDSGPPR